MTVCLALEKLYTDVAAAFTLELPNVLNVFGWREPTKQKVQPRIVWVPGDPSGSLGAFGPAKYPGRNPRSLATLEELFTVEVFSYDAATPENELAQYKATRLLVDDWFRFAYNAARGTFRIVSSQWITTKNERRHGATVRMICAVQAMVPDAVQSEMTVAGSSADIDVEVEDVTENVTVTQS